MAAKDFYLSSSNLAGGSYDEATLDLTINFQNGTAYVYRGVQPETVQGLIRAPSAGEFFHRQIKGRYGYEPL
jgi:hypothetical protein